MIKSIKNWIMNRKEKNSIARLKKVAEELYRYTGIKTVLFQKAPISINKTLVFPILLESTKPNFVPNENNDFKKIYTYVEIDKLIK